MSLQIASHAGYGNFTQSQLNKTNYDTDVVITSFLVAIYHRHATLPCEI